MCVCVCDVGMCGQVDRVWVVPDQLLSNYNIHLIIGNGMSAIQHYS